VGTFTPLTSSVPDVTFFQVQLFNTKIYVVDNSLHLYPLNSTEDGWDTPLDIPIPISGTQFKFVEFESKLYLYDYIAPYSSALMRLNDTADAVITVCDNAGYVNIKHACVFNSRLYAGAQTSDTAQPILIRLNVAGNDWELVCTVDYEISSLASFDGKLFVNTVNINEGINGFERLNDGGDAVIPICPFGNNIGFWATPVDGGVLLFDSNLYYIGQYTLFKLNATENGFDLLSQTTGEAYNCLAVINDYLHIGGSLNLYRLEGTSCINLWNNNPVSIYSGSIHSMGVKSNKLYFICDLDITILYKYVSLNPSVVASQFNTTSNQAIGYELVPMNFYSAPYSDYAVVSFDWNFGDTTHGIYQTETHSYESAGLYIVSLTIQNDAESLTLTKFDYVQVFDSTVIDIHTVEELQLIGNDGGYPVTSQYRLANDIDASATISWNEGEGFLPLCPSPFEFRGNFDGAGHKISNLHMNQPSGSSVALFGIANGASFSSLTIENSTVRADGYASILLVNAYGLVTMSDCTVSGTLRVNGNGVNGFTTTINNAFIASRCTADFTTYSGSPSAFGNIQCDLALYDNNMGASISNSIINLNAYECSTYVGSLASIIRNCIVTDCTGTISSIGNNTANAGGLIGYGNENYIILNCYTSGFMNLGDGNITTIGGLLGYAGDTKPNHEIINCSANIDMTAGPNGIFSYIAGLIGNNITTPLIGCSSSGNITLSGISANYIAGLVGYSNGSLTSCHSTGDIIVDCTANNVSRIGGLAGSQYLTVLNCYAIGNITTPIGSQFVGGLIGYGYLDQLENCFASGDVLSGSDSNYIGGLVGQGSFYVTGPLNCHATGNVTGGGYIGGLVGQLLFLTTSQCFATGTVRTDGTYQSYAGGLVGDHSGNLLNCYATGNVLSTNSTMGATIAGFAGHFSDGTITNCYSAGLVIGPSGNRIAYACTDNSNIFRQINGRENFQAFGSILNWSSISLAKDNSLYACVTGGDIYKQLYGGGSLIIQGAGDKDWSWILATPSGDVYASVNLEDIYVQTGGIDAFNPLNQTYRAWKSMMIDSSGNILAFVPGEGIYARYGGLGDFQFVSSDVTNAVYGYQDTQGIYYILENPGYIWAGNLDNLQPLPPLTSHNWTSILVRDNTAYATASLEDIYKYDGSSLVPMLQGALQWTSICEIFNHNLYASAYGSDLFVLTPDATSFIALDQGALNWTQLITSRISPNTIGGFIGNLGANSTIINSYWNFETSDQRSSAGGQGKTTGQMLTISNYTNWDFTGLWKLIDSTS
jgi:PKD repeat protein